MPMNEPLLAEDEEQGPTSSFDAVLNSNTVQTFEKRLGVDVSKVTTTLKAFAGGQAGGSIVASKLAIFLREWPMFLMTATQAVVLAVTIYTAPTNLLGEWFRILPCAGLGLIAIMNSFIIKFLFLQDKTCPDDHITIDKSDEFFQSLRDGPVKLALTLLMWLTSCIMTTHFKYKANGVLMACVQLADHFQNNKAVKNLVNERRRRQHLTKQNEELTKAKEKLAEQNDELSKAKEKLEGDMSRAQDKVETLEARLRELKNTSGCQEDIKNTERELQASKEHARKLEEEHRKVNDLQDELKKAETEAQKRFDQLQQVKGNESQMLKQDLAEAKQQVVDLEQELEDVKARGVNMLAAANKVVVEVKTKDEELMDCLREKDEEMRQLREQADAAKAKAELQENKAVEAERKAKEEVQEQMQRYLNAANDKLQEANSQLEAERKAKEEANSQSEAAMLEVSELQSKLYEEQRQREFTGSAAATEMQQLRQQVSELEAKLSEQERQHESAKGQREAASSAAATEAEQLRRQVSKLQSKLSGAEAAVSELEAKLSEEEGQREAAISAAAIESEQLRRQVSELQSKLSEEERQRESTGSAAATEMQQLRQQVSELEAKLSERERQHESAGAAAVTEVERLRQQASELQSRLTEQQQQHESASSTAAAEAEQLKGQVSELQAKLDAEEEARLKAEEEAAMLTAKEEEAARLKAEEEVAARKAEEARLKAEEEARLKEEDEAVEKLTIAIRAKDIGSLENAIAHCEAMKLKPPELTQARDALVHQRQFAAWLDGLKKGTADRNKAKLCECLDEAADRSLEDLPEVVQAKIVYAGIVVDEAMVPPQKAVDLREALDGAAKVGLTGDSVDKAREALRAVEARDKEVEGARQKVARAVASRELDKVADALKAGREVGLDSDELQELQALHAELEKKAEEAARDGLKAAASGNDVEKLRAAIADGQAVGLQENDPDMLAARSAMQVLRMKSTIKPLSDILENLQKDGKLTKGDTDMAHSRLEECFPPAAYLKQVGRSEGLSDQEFAEAISAWTEQLAKLAADVIRYAPDLLSYDLKLPHHHYELLRIAKQRYRDIIANWLLTFAEETLVPVSERLASWSFPFFDRERKRRVTRVDMLTVLLIPLVRWATSGIARDRVNVIRADGVDLASGANFCIQDPALDRFGQNVDEEYIWKSYVQEVFGVDAWFAFLSKDGLLVPDHTLKMIQDILAIIRDVLTRAIESGLKAILPTVGRDFVMERFKDMEEAIEDAPKDALLGRSAEDWGDDLPGGVEVWGADLGDDGRDLVEALGATSWEPDFFLGGRDLFLFPRANLVIQKAVSGVRDFLQAVQANKRCFSKAIFMGFAPSKLLELFDDTVFEVIAPLFDIFWQICAELEENAEEPVEAWHHHPIVKAWLGTLKDVTRDSGEDAVKGRILFKIEVELKKLLSTAFVGPLCDFLFDVVKVQDADLLLKLLRPSATSPPERLKERMTLLFNTFPSKNDEHLNWEAVWHFVERIALSAPKLIKGLLNVVCELLSMLCKELILPSASKLLSGASGGQNGVTLDDVRRFIEENRACEGEDGARRSFVFKEIFGSMFNIVMSWEEPRDGSKTQAHMGDS